MKNTKQTKDDKMKKPKQHPKQKGFRMGLRAKILGISLPITIIMVIAMIAIAYSVSEKDIMKSSQSLLRTSAKDQGNQIEAWLNRKLDEVKTVKYDLEHSGAVKDQKLLQKKLNDYYALDDSFVGGFYVTDTAGTVMKADDNTTQINNAKDQIWYQKGLTRMNPGYTPVFEDAENHMMISACGMLDDATNIRILSTNLSLDSVNIIVNSSVSMQGAESLLVDKSTGDILASRESELIATSIKDTSNGFLKNVADKINKDDESVTTIRDKVVVTREIAGTDWVLVSYVPTSLITSEVDNLRTILIGVAIIGLLVFTLLNGVKSISNNIVVPMIADCTDYEYTLSGHFVPGIMGALFSFIDKSFSALGTGFVGIALAIAGYSKVFPQVEDPLTPQLKFLTIFFYCIIPIIGWIVTIFIMRFYKLDKNTMRGLYKK